MKKHGNGTKKRIDSAKRRFSAACQGLLLTSGKPEVNNRS
jgi:hypothetical protein